MDLWESSLPGAGAQRAVLVLQLYMRMGNYNPLSILVSDALCLTFKAGGATVAELSAYLGLLHDRVEAGVEGMPRELYCTSSDLPQDEINDNDKHGELGRKRKSATKRSRQDATEESALRYYINYTTLLPFVFAHGTHMLLALCQLPLPKSTGSSGPRGELASLNVSPTLRRADCRRGLCCMSCRYWMALKDLQSTISRCPLCQTDILASVLNTIKLHYEEKLAKDEPLLSFRPLQQKQHQRSENSGNPMTSSGDVLLKKSNSDAGDYPLARDPFVVQQGLFFQFLFSRPFVCVNKSSFVVDADEVMTLEEYEHRSRHRASVLDQFRLVHRNAAAIHVKLVDGAKIDTAKYMENALKLAKRTQLPPWLRPSPLFSDGDVLPPLSAATEMGGQGLSSAVPAKKTKRGGNIAATAAYIAQEFFDDDFDEVQLRRSL